MSVAGASRRRDRAAGRRARVRRAAAVASRQRRVCLARVAPARCHTCLLLELTAQSVRPVRNLCCRHGASVVCRTKQLSMTATLTPEPFLQGAGGICAAGAAAGPAAQPAAGTQRSAPRGKLRFHCLRSTPHVERLQQLRCQLRVSSSVSIGQRSFWCGNEPERRGCHAQRRRRPAAFGCLLSTFCLPLMLS